MQGNLATTVVPPQADLTTCDREPIHIPGAIQPHGILLGITRSGLRISSVSANLDRYCGTPAAESIGLPLSACMDAHSLGLVTGCDALQPGESARLSRLQLFGDTSHLWRATLHDHGTDLMLEAEPLQPDADLTALDHFERFQESSQRVQSARDVATSCHRLAEEVRRLTGYDRVKVYRFAQDWSGEVIAEARSDTMPSYLGLHFPASDIPVQARALYTRNPERQIPDVGFTPVTILQNTPDALDLSQIGLRSVSPIHIRYLRNMDVGASMSISILQQGRLWGLVACHHSTLLYVAPELRHASVILAQIAASRLGLIEEAEIARRSIAVKAVETTLLREAADGRDYRAALLRNHQILLELLDATGLAITSSGSVTTLGKTPTGEALQNLLDWLVARGPALLATDHLAAQYPPAAGMVEATGILSVPLGGVPQNLLVWFRPEFVRTVSWAGDPAKPAEPLTPRHSFATWTEQLRGRSRPWEAIEIAAANGLRDTIVDIIVRRSIELEQVNTQLAHSNEELETFAYIASHDLKEPLRQIETFGTLLQRAFSRKSDPAEKVARWFAGIQTSSRRLRLLIDQLAEYSRLGAQAMPLVPVDLEKLFAAVMRDLDGRIAEAGAQIEVSGLPVVMCDAMQMRQVLQNLLSNAIKYRDPTRVPSIRINAEAPVQTAAPLHGFPVLQIRIEDNGIGFEEHHCDRIFAPFERLHSSDEYEGTGLGLAICRKVIDRHGGVITARGRAGEGAVFTITLPLRPLPEREPAKP